MKKVAVITGASSGIGEAIAEFYRGVGYRVLPISRTSLDLPCDFTDRKQVHTLLDKIELFKGIDVLVNNAGMMPLDESPSHAVNLYNALLYTPYLLITTMIPNFREGAHIINIASVSGITADPDSPMYSALKAGIINLTKSFAKILAPQVRVNCISPGFFNTNLVKGPAPDEMIMDLPIPYEANPREIIPVVSMLQYSPYMTGANIVIDGGLSL